jgi:ribosome biogenesis GTPase
VGDWVGVKEAYTDNAHVRLVLPRLTSVVRQLSGSRKGAGRNEGRVGEQVIAANVDRAFIVSGLDRDFNLRRIERYVTLAYASGLEPVVILNKADLAEDPEAIRLEVEATLAATKVIILSAATGEGMEALNSSLGSGVTACLLGSSGVGKSSLLNRLLGGEIQSVGEVGGPAGKGRHTTTHRELFLLPGGAIMVDTPGLREIGLVGDKEAVNAAFSEIDGLGKVCKFRNCTHSGEPGCAVEKAVLDGELATERLASFKKINRELSHQTLRDEKGAAVAERTRWKHIKVVGRKMPKRR